VSVKHENIRDHLRRIRERATAAGVDDGFQSACDCGESQHLNELHDLAGSNVPWLLAIADGLLNYADQKARIVAKHPAAESLDADVLWQLREILNVPVEDGDPDFTLLPPDANRGLIRPEPTA
jgi:hypothetical protein